MRRVLLSLVLALAFGWVVSTPTEAARYAVADPRGDDPTNGPVLDITRLRVNSRDHQVVVEVSFVQAGRGYLVVLLQERDEPRSASLTGVSSHHRPRRGDINGVGNQDGAQSCPHLSVGWDHERDTAIIRLPSNCVDGGEYGDLRVKVFTELVVDQDFAPQGPPRPHADEPTWRWTPWVARG